MFDHLLPTKSRERIAAENRAELQVWIDERTDALIARGLPRDDAHRQALAEFGDVDFAEQYAQQQDVAANRRARAGLWLEELTTDLRIAARTLARTPTVTAVVLLTFALGIGATTAVFSVVHAMLLRELPYGESGLVYLPAVDDGVIRPGLGGARHSATAVVALRERTASFSGLAAVSMGNGNLRGSGDPEQIWISNFTPNAFHVWQVRPAIGRAFTDAEADGSADVVLLTDSFWRRRFGADSSIVGKTIDFSGERLEVIGIMPPGFRVPTYEQAELLAPVNLDHFYRNPNTTLVRAQRMFGRIKPGLNVQTAQADVDRAMRSLQNELPTSFRGIETRVVPIRAAIAGTTRTRLLVLMGAAVFVLLIACANVAGILLSRAIARRHELAVRVALGAGRRRLVRQFLAEGVVIATLGAMLGLVVAQLGIGALRQIAVSTLPEGTSFALEPWVVAFAIGSALVAALASTLFPAMGGTKSLGIAFRRHDGRSSPTRASRRIRLGLVAGQLAVSVVLLVGAGLFVRTLSQLAALDLGYSTERVLVFRPLFSRPKNDKEQDAYYATLYAQLRAIPGVASVGGGNVPTSGQGTMVGMAIEGRVVDASRLPDVRYTPASDDFFSTLQIPLVRGRLFTPDDHSGVPWVALVSAGLAKQQWPNADPIGARVQPEPNKPWATVVGVVGDVRVGGADAPHPTVYTSQRQDHWPGAGWVIVRAQGDPAALTVSIRDVVRRIDPTLVIVGLRTLEEVRQSTPAIADRRLQMQLMLAFAVIALAVSAIGIYGVCAYATEARSREFGIRMALGSSRGGVLWLAIREGASVAIIGSIIGVPLAWLLATRIRDMLFGVAPFDLPTVAVVLVTLGAVALAASFVPARRATLVDPVRTMRSD